MSLDRKINIIYRNYKEENIDPVIKKIKELSRINNRNIFVSNNLKIALKYNLSGLYLPSFNTILKYKNINFKQGFKLIGSAHNYREIKIKEKQGCEEIFISPIFNNPKNKYFLDIVKFNNLRLFSKVKVIALGGINKENLKKLKCTKISGFAGITWIKKTGLIKLGRFK